MTPAGLSERKRVPYDFLSAKGLSLPVPARPRNTTETSPTRDGRSEEMTPP